MFQPSTSLPIGEGRGGGNKTFTIMTNKTPIKPSSAFAAVRMSLSINLSIEFEVKRLTEYIKMLAQSSNTPDGDFDPKPLSNVLTELKDLNSYLEDSIAMRLESAFDPKPADNEK